MKVDAHGCGNMAGYKRTFSENIVEKIGRQWTDLERLWMTTQCMDADGATWMKFERPLASKFYQGGGPLERAATGHREATRGTPGPKTRQSPFLSNIPYGAVLGSGACRIGSQRSDPSDARPQNAPIAPPI